MSGISLTASMRSNLLSLQNIASRQDIVQNRLATGLKVSSAIDNPSSYYTASSLNNRAADLTALLDTMSQGIQTIKAASEAIDAGTKFLEQAKAVANQALETAQPIIARVSTEAELLAAVDSGQKGLVVIEKTITLSNNTSLYLKEGQSLVGARYLDKTAAETAVNFNFDGQCGSGIITANNTLISDLSINFTGNSGSASGINANSGAVSGFGVSGVTIQNVTINTDVSAMPAAERLWLAGIHFSNSSSAVIRGQINISTNGHSSRGIAAYYGSHIKIEDALLNIQISGTNSHGLVSAYDNSRLDICGRSIVNAGNTSYRALYNYEAATTIPDDAVVNFSSHAAPAVYNNNGGIILQDRGRLNITTEGENGYGIDGGYLKAFGNSTVNILTTGFNGEGAKGIEILLENAAKLNIQTEGENGEGIINGKVTARGQSELNIHTLGNAAAGFAGGSLDIEDSAEVNLQREHLTNILYLETAINLKSAQAQLSLKGADSYAFDGKQLITAVTGAVIITEAGKFSADNDITTPVSPNAGNIPPAGFSKTGTSAPINIDEIRDFMTTPVYPPETFNPDTKTDSKKLYCSFTQIINQYDSLINDAAYKGTNLLKGQSLKINFNEDRSSMIKVQGTAADSLSIGISQSQWGELSAIENALNELENAVNTLRSLASEFGNYYSIVTTRQDFTENLINVLEEGADKLTLADMNQESANMLALQTSQQLAVNSLSLASKASQAVLKLF